MFDSSNIYKAIINEPLENVLPRYLKNYKKSGGNYDIADSPFSGTVDQCNHMRINKQINRWSDFALEGKYRFGTLIDFVELYFHENFRQAIAQIVHDFPDKFPVDKSKMNFSHIVINHEDFKKKEYIRPYKNPAEIDLAYRVLLKISFLSKKDRQVLHEKRHLSDQEIKQYRLFTFPSPTAKYRQRLRACVMSNGRMPEPNDFDNNRDFSQAYAKWLNQYGKKTPAALKRMEFFLNVPGFYVENGEITWTYGDGLGIPTFDLHNHIIGIQIRTRYTSHDGVRYFWFSSGAKMQMSDDIDKSKPYGGMSAGSPIYFLDNKPSEPKDLIITEGFFKGVQYRKAFHTKVAALPGVGNFRKLDAIIKELLSEINVKFLHNTINKIIISYDADSLTNKNVLHQEMRLFKDVSRFELPVYVLFWDQKQGKGFDDLVFNHPKDYRKYLHYQKFEDFIEEMQKMAK